MPCICVIRRFGLLAFFFFCSLLSFLYAEPLELQDTKLTVQDIEISGNYKTRQKVILSELPFAIGSSIEMMDLMVVTERAKENLLNTSLFNSVEISFYYPDIHSVVFTIEVSERWYLWVFPIFENEGRNFSDFLRLNDGSFFNYGLYVKHDNFRGRKEVLKLRAVTGYKTQLVFGYRNPGLNNQSGWGIDAGWLWNDRVAYGTVDDKQVFLKTLGDRLLTTTNVTLSYYYRHNLDHYHSVFAGFMNIDAADTLLAYNPDMLPLQQSTSETITLGYNYKYDKRDSKIYPLKGLFIEAEIIREGFGLESDYEGFFRGRGAVAYHNRLGDKLYYNTRGFVSLVDLDKVPYIFRTGLGYEEYLNGFEFRVIDGTSYGGLQSKLLYELIPRKDIRLKWMPLEQFSHFHYAFYIKLHFDAGYVYNNFEQDVNRMANELLLGYGVGIDMLTFYDKVLSLNYSFNNFAEHGFYFHFNLTL